MKSFVVYSISFESESNEQKKWEHSSAGRASALQAEGHRFEPYCFHQILHTALTMVRAVYNSSGPVVQSVRTLACHARGRGFESHPGRQLAKQGFCLCSSVGRAGD